MRKESKPLNLRLILLLGTAILLIVVHALGLFSNLTTPIERLEYSMQDTFVRLRGVETVSDDIVIVAIDDASFQWNGLQWPWPRSYFAEIADQISAGGGKVLGMDVLLFEPDEKNPQNDALFANALGPIPATVGVIEVR